MLAHNQGGLLNASRLAAGLMVSAQTITRYVAQQKLIPHEFSVDELFDDVTRALI